MSTPQKLKDKEYRNWVKCSLSLTLMKKELHGYVDTGVKNLHLHIKTNLSSTLGGPSVGTLCGSCTWKDVKKKWGNPITWNMKCRNSVCDRWLSEILSVHTDPHSHSINWKNADISQWPTNPYEIAKVYMPKGQDRIHNLPQELDAPAILSLLKYCTWFSKNIPNVQLLSDLIDVRNEVLHSGDLKVIDSNKDIWIDKMIQLLSDLNVNSNAQSELNRIKCEDIDVSFRENEIQALQNLVSGLRSEFTELTGEMASLQNVQTQQSEETTKHAEEVQELKKIYDKMETFLNNNPDINDIEITKNMTDFKKDIQEELSQIKAKVSSHEDRLVALDDRFEKHKEETQLQFKGVGRQLAALENKRGNNIQPIHQKVACSGPTASTSSSSNNTRIPHNGPINTISSLRPSQRGWRICVRVTNKNTISKFKIYGGWNQRFNVSLADDSGSIEAVAFGEAANKFYKLLEEQKVYYISGATIKKANRKFSQGNAYDMVLEDDTNIELCDDEDNLDLPTEISYNSVEIDKLEPGRLCDVVGVVKDFQTKTIGKWSSIEVHIVDRSKKMVPLRLNMKDVENLDLSENQVIAVKGAWLKNSNGHIYLKKMPSTKIKTNPDTRETDLLLRWFAREGHRIKFEKI